MLWFRPLLSCGARTLTCCCCLTPSSMIKLASISLVSCGFHSGHRVQYFQSCILLYIFCISRSVLQVYCKSFLASLLETYHSTLLRSLCSSGQGCISLTFYKRALVCHGHITNPPCPASYCGLTKNNISHLEKHTFLSRKSDKPTNFPTDTHAFSVMSKRLLNGFQRS